jgi:hypothetical protein
VSVRVSEVRGEAWILYPLDPSVVAPHLCRVPREFGNELYQKLLLVLLITGKYEYMKEVFVVRHQVQTI